MNTILVRDVAEELFGDDQEFKEKTLRHVLRIHRWLGFTTLPPYQVAGQARFASSLIARTDVEFLGLSGPRFCIRLYNDEHGLGFFNLRRSALIQNAFCESKESGGWSKRSAKRGSAIEDFKPEKNPAKPDKPHLIGDCLFAVPRRFKPLYRILSSNFHPHYGEPLTIGPGKRPEPLTTPYVQYSFIVGLCGHAAIYIASMLMHNYARNIHGLAEIGEILGHEDKDEFLITGLAPRHIESYFAHPDVGLRANLQLCPSRYEHQLNNQLGLDDVQCLRSALRSYLLSGMPVIKYVDQQRMYGYGPGFAEGRSNTDQSEAIYVRNRTGHRIAKPRDHSPDPHAVVLIGCGRKNEGRADDFILHDPAWFPYLEASTRQLMECSAYTAGADPVGTGEASLTRLWFQPVTPPEVKMPLQRYQIRDEEGNDRLRPGLFQFARLVYSDLDQNPEFPGLTANQPEPEEVIVGEFRLVQAKDILKAFDDAEWALPIDPRARNVLRANVRTISEKAIERNRLQWFWVQRFSRSFWVWDAMAEVPPEHEEDLAELKRLVIAVAGSHDEEDHRIGDEAKISAPEKLNHTALRRELAENLGDWKRPRLALLTSFSGLGLLHSCENWPEPESDRRVQFAELYAFMQGDLPRLLNDDSLKGLPAAIAMHQLVTNDDVIRQLAEEVGALADGKGIKITGLATFVAELLDPERTEIGINAFNFLCKFCRELRELKHDVHVIELVGGGIVEGLVPGRLNGTPALLAKRLRGLRAPGPEASAATHRLLAAVAQLKRPLEENDVKLALEIEPGRLFAFTHQDDLLSVCSEISRMEESGVLPVGRMGLNLDVGHWMLSGIEPTVFLESRITERILNVHISGHAKGHIGDTVIGQPVPLRDFETWMMGIGRLPIPSISIEYECVKDEPTLLKAIEEVQDLVGRVDAKL